METVIIDLVMVLLALVGVYYIFAAILVLLVVLAPQFTVSTVIRLLEGLEQAGLVHVGKEPNVRS